MKNIVTAKTAQALKDSGFKQPKPKRGQAWYSITDVCVIVTGQKSGHILVVNKNGDGIVDVDTKKFMEDFIFAPTAIDILKELGSAFALTLPNKLVSDNAFCMQLMPSAITTVRVHAEWEHENPAEACAMAWLEKYVK